MSKGGIEIVVGKRWETPQKITLTSEGRKRVMTAFLSSVDEMESARKALIIAEVRYNDMQKALNCDHELVDGGFAEAILTTCTKCGFAWVD